MSPTEAAKLLDVPADATPEQLEARFHELRTKLEDKIAKAPTPGLKAKYRESLEQITTAFETLTLAADSSSLPIATKQGHPSGRPVSAPAALAPSGPGSQVPLPGDGPDQPRDGSSQQRRGLPPAKRTKSGKEFAVVALIAVLLLGAGGWFVMKTRADNEGKARIALETEQKRAAAEQAELRRVNALKTSLRTKLVEYRVDWEARESELQDAERRANDLKSELRGLRDATAVRKAELSGQATAHEFYARWLKAFLLRHPAKLTRAKAEELLQAGAFDEAAAAVAEIGAALEKLGEDVGIQRRYFLEATTAVHPFSEPEGVRWILTDAYGRTREGVTPAEVYGLPLTHLAPQGVSAESYPPVEQRGEFTTGKMTIRFVRPGWPDVVEEVLSWGDDDKPVTAKFPEGAITVSSLPAGVPFKITQIIKDHGWSASGTAPATVTGVPVGRVRVTLSRPGYGDVYQNIDIEEGKTVRTVDIDHRSQPVAIKVAEPARILVDGKPVGTQNAQIPELTPGEHVLQLETAGYATYRTKFAVKQTSSPLILNYSFKELAIENINCTACSARGNFTERRNCFSCDGRGWIPWTSCCERGYWGGKRCEYCGGDNRVDCTGDGKTRCRGDGVIDHTWPCGDCAGDGKRSRLQLGI